MLSQDWLIDLLHRPELSITDKLLGVLLDSESSEKTVDEIRATCLPIHPKLTNYASLSTFLQSARKQGRVAMVNGKWRLLQAGRDYLSTKGVSSPSVLTRPQEDIRVYLSKISNPEIRSFVQETMLCLEAGALRAAVVMSWVGAVAILYEHVLKHHLTDFNQEAKRRNLQKGKDATTLDNLAAMKESDFLDVLEGINVFGKNTKQELQSCLQRRNGCGHPNTHIIGAQTVAHHIEVLILCVYSKF